MNVCNPTQCSHMLHFTVVHVNRLDCDGVLESWALSLASSCKSYHS